MAVESAAFFRLCFRGRTSKMNNSVACTRLVIESGLADAFACRASCAEWHIGQASAERPSAFFH